MEFIQKVKKYIVQHHMICAGDHVSVGVSGGADSVCLLLVLLKLREELGHTVSAVHVEHGIRGEDSKKDAEFVRHFCGRQGIECHIFHYNVPEYAGKHGMSEEEAGRQLRYAAFAAEAGKYPDDKGKIAVAHHMEDHAETMLFHLARGTGIRGLAGIAPVRGNIIRPLLAVKRAEIEAFLNCQGQTYCTDATNEDDSYSRNRIRRQALPVLEKINSRACEHMYQTARQLREIDDYLKKQAELALQVCCKRKEHGLELQKEAFDSMDAVIQKEMLHRLLIKLSGGGRDITMEHVCQIKDLFAKQNGRKLCLPYGIKAVRVYKGVELFFGKDAQNNDDIKHGGDSGKNQFRFRLINNFSNNIPQISKKKYTKCFDYDKIKNGFCVRSRQPGDFLVVNASGDRQKLKKYLVNEKIPEKEREQLLLLADGSHIMWIVGHRISSYYKVSEYTRRILEVTFYGGKEDE